VQQAQRAAHHRVTPGGVPARRSTAGPVEVLAQRAHQHPVQQPVEDDLLARRIGGDLGGEVVPHGVGSVAGAHPQDDGQRVQQPATDLAAHRIGADDQGRRVLRAGTGVVPAEPVPGPALLGRRAERAARDGFGPGAHLVDEEKRCGTPHDHRLTDAQTLGRAVLRHDPAASAKDGAQGQRRAVHEVQRPRRGQGRTAEQRALGPHSAQ
jgi:hypothetical protein